MIDENGYRKNVGIILCNSKNKLLICKLSKKDVEILGKTKNWLKYDLPKKYQRRTNNKLCVGQKQIWFLLKLITNESSINLSKSKKPEFDAWEWSSVTKPLEIVINFKKNVYKSALEELLPIIKN